MNQTCTFTNALGMPLVAQWNAVSALSGLNYWQEEALTELSRIARLPENWDGYGSPPLSQKAREQAADLIDSLASNAPPSSPHIAPVPGGGLQFEWDYLGRYMELEILPNGNLEFLLCNE